MGVEPQCLVVRRDWGRMGCYRRGYTPTKIGHTCKDLAELARRRAICREAALALRPPFLPRRYRQMTRE